MSIVRISKTFDFDAAHRLPTLPKGHKCRRMHGHTYKVEIICEGKLDEHGMVCDYAALQALWTPVHKQIDHRYLNKIPGLQMPTTEVLARWIFQKLRDGASGPPASIVVMVRVYESSTTYAEYPTDAERRRSAAVKAVAEIQANAKAEGLDKLTDHQIDQEISDARMERARSVRVGPVVPQPFASAGEIERRPDKAVAAKQLEDLDRLLAALEEDERVGSSPSSLWHRIDGIRAEIYNCLRYWR